MERAASTSMAAASHSALGGSSETSAMAQSRIEDVRLRQAAIDYFPNVWRFLRRLGVPWDLLDDAAQEVFLVAARKFASVRVGAEKSYLFGVSVRVAREIRRKSGREQLVDDPDDTAFEPTTLATPESLFDRKQEQALLLSLLDSLSDQHRTVFILFEIEGLSISEIAELLGTPAGTVGSRLARARERFEARLQRPQSKMRGRT